MIKTFRGKLASGAQDRIRLGTNDGLRGYRMVKFQCMPTTPGTNQTESIVKVFTLEQTSVNNTVDFTSPTLIAAMYLASSNGSNEAYAEELHTVFDNMTFNQDIYITAVENTGARETNWYIELEIVKLDVNEATVATLKDMRGRE